MDEDPKLSTLELIVLGLTVYVCFSIILQLVIEPSKEMIKLFSLFEVICSGIFLWEWGYRFYHSKEKKKFVVRNFIDLIASFPIGFLGSLKALRLVRIFQVVKFFGSVNRFRTYLRNNKVHIFKLILFSLITLLMLVSPVMILWFEEDGGGSINTAENALWWTYCTISTIGYGDLYPVTSGGRLFTVFVSLGGIGAFSIFSGLIVNYIIQKVKEDDESGN